MSLGLLINKPLNNFKHLIGNIGDLHTHEKTKYNYILNAQD